MSAFKKCGAQATTWGRPAASSYLPDAFAADPDRLARFQREAQVLASLNHPGIAAIYGIEKTDDTQALVLELVEGPTLSDRIVEGPIPLDEALPIAKQIAEALEAAHEAGVIHRDLKPANIKVREDGTVKVLDFGLAKALDTAPEGDPSQSPTLTAAATQRGVIMGTAAYMSPEQARGKTVDTRADIWAFGCVLYEMLTGTRAFEGRDVSETLAGVIKTDPRWGSLPPDTPRHLHNVLRRCVEKEPRQRVQAIGDVRLAMDGAFETTVSTSSEPTAPPHLAVWQRPAPAIALGLMFAVMTSFVVWVVTRVDVVPAEVMRFALVARTSYAPGAGRGFAISSDGTQVAYRGPVGRNLSALYLRGLDQLEVMPLRGGENGASPFFSPDGQWVGFTNFLGAPTLRKVATFGGPPETVTESPNDIRGAAWGTDGQIVFGTAGAGLFRVSEDGGEPEPLTTLDREQGEASHTWPSIIPDHDAVVFVIGTGASLSTWQLAVLDLDTRQVTRLGLAGVSPHYVTTGHLVYAAVDGALRAVPFDATSLTATGTPVPVLDGVRVTAEGAAAYTLSDNGRLVYETGAAGGVVPRSLVWVDRNGREEPIAAAPLRGYVYPRISPDGARVAVDIQDEARDIWVWDLADETLTRFTSDTPTVRPHWTPDGQRVVYNSLRSGERGFYAKLADGTGPVESLGEFTGGVSDVTETHVVANRLMPDRGTDVVIMTLDGDSPPQTFLGTEFNEGEGDVSPDGEWLAFESDETGRFEIYVYAFPDAEAGRSTISTGGGRHPLWSRTGSELFYWADNQFMVVPIQTTPSFSRGTPRMLFEGPYFQALGRTYDVASDARFLMIKAAAEVGENTPSQQVNVVLNWLEELKRLVPVP